MFDFNQEGSLVKFKCSPFAFTCLCQLWEKTKTKSAKHSSLFITENILAPIKDQVWRLILSPDFYALLVANKHDGYYDAEITFDQKIIQDFLIHLSTQLPSNHTIHKRLKLELHRDQRFNHHFVFELIKILVDNDQYISLHNSIGNHIPKQLSELLDPITTLLTLDRLFIYQIDTINSIIYERLNPNLAIDFLSNLENQDDLVDLPNKIDCYRQGKTLVTNDIRQSDYSPNWQRRMDQLAIQSVVIIPILVEDQLWGLLAAHRTEDVPPWNNHDVQILSMAAIAISGHFNHLKTNELLKRRNQKLEHKIIGQNQEIQDILITTQIAQESKNDFLETMSHELRTPLTCVIGLSSTLLHWSLDPDNPLISFDKQRKYLQSIHDNGRHLLDLINNILDFSEIEAGRLTLEIHPFSLRETLNYIHEIFKVEIKQHNLNFNINFYLKESEDIFYGDKNRIEQIMYQLIDNAIKFTPAGGEVNVTTMKEAGVLIFEVQDTGIGISKKQLPLLFEKFKQLEKSRQRTYGGTGLGLALTKYLVELHQGQIEIKSQVAKGSLFRVVLPDQRQIIPKFRFQEQSDRPTINQPNPDNTIVLIAQDEESSTMICQLLTAANYQVIWLVDDLISVDNVQILRPWLLIIDQRLPNFPHLIDSLKGLLNIHALKLLVLGNESKYLADDFMNYPIKPQQLLQKVNNLAKHRQENLSKYKQL